MSSIWNFFKFPKLRCETQEYSNDTSPNKIQGDNEEIDDEIKQILNNPNATPEEKEMMKKELEKQEFQPPVSFGKLGMQYKNGIEDEKWHGLRFNLDYKPNQLFSVDYAVLFEKNKKLLNNIRVSCMSFIPFDERGQYGVMLVGRKEGDQALALQGHFILSAKDKISLLCQNPKSDLSQAAYAGEYTHDFDRMNMSVKVSNMEPLTISSLAAVHKNLFLGCEAYKHPKTFSWGYNYALCYKANPQNRLGFNLTYLSLLPLIGLDLNFKYSKSWNFFLNLSRNWNPMMSTMGGSSYEAKISSIYSENNLELGLEVDYQGTVHCYSTYNFFKSIALQLNIELNPFARWSKRNKKHIRSFGLGLKMTSSPMEEELQNLFTTDIEEGVEDYEYDKVLNENVK